MKHFLPLCAVLLTCGLQTACTVPAGGRGLRVSPPRPLNDSRPLRLREDEAAASADLAKKTQNPVSDLISVPLQTNMGFDFGADNDVQTTLNVQPVVPVDMGDWSLLNRPILPLVYLPETGPGTEDEFGLGDATYTAWYSPKGEPGKPLWGIGAVTQLPTHSEDALGLNAFGIGPSIVCVKMQGKWVYGGLLHNVWGVMGPQRNDLNLFLAQYFVNYNLDDGWYLTSSPIITSNWEVEASDRWTIPFGGGFGKILALRGLPPMNFNLQAFYNAETPEIGPEWSARFQLAMLFPK
jgi:hypothetical protein